MDAKTPVQPRFAPSGFASEQKIHDEYHSGKLSGKMYGIELERFRTNN